MINKAGFMQIIHSGKIAETLERLYNEIMGLGVRGFETRGVYKSACLYCVYQYTSHNDYIHANNIMQKFKSDLFYSGEVSEKWHICMSILIYGVRTPMYFITEPGRLFEKILRVYTPISKNAPADDKQIIRNKRDNVRLLSSIITLFKYYYNKFAARGNAYYAEFCKIVNTHFSKTAERYINEHPEIPSDIWGEIRKFIKYCSDPDKFAVLYEGLDDDEDDFDPSSEGTSDDNGNDNEKQTIDYVSIDGVRLPHHDCTKVEGTVLCVIGGRSDTITQFKTDVSAYRLKEIEHYKYDEIGSVDLKKKFYSKRDYMGIIIGESPHKGKGTEGYSSIITLLQSEGFPSTIKATAASGSQTTPKITRHSLLCAFRDLLYLPENLSHRA